MATLETRRAQLSDASIMSRLTLELGYDCTEVLMRQRQANAETSCLDQRVR